jgi:hypothetical protein
MQDEKAPISRRAKLWRWIKSHRPAVIAMIGGVLILAAAGTAYAILSQPLPKVDTTPIVVKKKAPPVKYYSLLNGIQIADQAAQKSPVTAIMIENSPEARPQSGLNQAEVVYEAIAEGGITRFLALYQQHKPQLIGPVRSVRMYYLDWLAPYQPSVAHVGGSAAALAEVRNGNYRDIDQFFNGAYYWRSTDRYAPHNVYTSFEKLDALNAKKGYTSSEFTSFPRTDGGAAKTQNATSVDVTISSALFNSHYDYDATTNTYKRSEGGEAHLDREEGQLAPSSVVVMDIDMSLIMQDGYREDITTSGTGKAYVFQNGVVQAVTWQKTDHSSPLRLIDAEGKDLSLVRGQTWITAVPNSGGGVTWK